VQLLKNCGQTAFALTETKKVGSDWAHWTRDDSLLESVRMHLGDQIASSNCAPWEREMANLASPPVVVANSSPAAAPETKRITVSAAPERLGSLDVFRGFIMLWIIGGEGLGGRPGSHRTQSSHRRCRLRTEPHSLAGASLL
jgi:hypothetical protein